MQNKIISYIKNGIYFSTPKRFRKSICAPVLIFLLLGLGPGIILGEYWLVIAIIMAIVSLLSVVGTWILSAKPFSVKNDLILQTILYGSYIFQFSMVETIIFTMMFGFNIFLILLLFSVALVPLCFSLKNNKALKLKEQTQHKRNAIKSVAGFGGLSGIVGLSLGKIFFNQVNQQTVVVVALFCLHIVNSLMALGLLSIHRLYCLYQLEKEGLLPTDFDTF